MKKIAMLVIQEFEPVEFFNHLEVGKELFDSLEVEYERIDVIIPIGKKNIVPLEFPFIQTIMGVEDVYKFYDDVVLLGNDEQILKKILRVINKTTVVSKQENEYLVEDLDEIIKEDYLKNSYIIGKDDHEINDIIDIYLEKLKVLQEEGEENLINDIKKGLSILYNRLNK